MELIKSSSQPPSPTFGTFWIICHICSTPRFEPGFSDEYDSKEPVCRKCFNKASIIEFRPLDLDADVDAT